MKSILLVDDEKNNRKSYELALKDGIPGLDILLAENELQGIEILKTQMVDVVITDLMMLSESGGIDVLKAAKEKDPLIPVIIITAFSKKLDRLQAFELGAFDCLEKGKVGTKMSDELIYKAKIALEFRSTTIELLESEKQKAFTQLLTRFFDPYVLIKYQEDQSLLTPREKVVTVAFWDIRGFSYLSDILRAHPASLTGFLTEFFEAASLIIYQNGGILDKFIGDGVMAIFGAFEDGKERENAISAVNASFELRKRFNMIYENWKKKWDNEISERYDQRIGLGCGIHTGECIVGLSGTDKRDHFTAIGHNVNFAARLEQSSQKEQIRVSKPVKARLDGTHYKCRLIDPAPEFKNIPRQFDTYEVFE